MDKNTSEPKGPISPATVGVDHRTERPVKRPDGWPELAVPVRNRMGPADRKGIATVDLHKVVRRKEMRK
jgi:hypothetical protein